METTSPLATTISFDQQFFKTEDMHTPASPSPSTVTRPSETSIKSASPPPPVIIQSKPAKKRKSWGQELPEPKTTLPPRKRAKTDDEKEQRRIERIKRNRAAAHNSRERKRQETETLAVALARANAELNAYKQLHGPLPPDIVLPDVQLCTDDYDTPAPSSTRRDSHCSFDIEASPLSPADTLVDSASIIKDEPTETSPLTSLPPAAFENLDGKSSLLLSLPKPLDQTQHSAAMLCDLQCRSRAPTIRSTTTLTTTTTPLTTMSTRQASWWAMLFLSLTAMHLQTAYKTILLSFWTISPSRMARWMSSASTRLSTSASTTSSSTTTPPLSPWTMALAQQSNAATAIAHRRLRQRALGWNLLDRSRPVSSRKAGLERSESSRGLRKQDEGELVVEHECKGEHETSRSLRDGVGR